MEPRPEFASIERRIKNKSCQMIELSKQMDGLLDELLDYTGRSSTFQSMTRENTKLRCIQESLNGLIEAFFMECIRRPAENNFPTSAFRRVNQPTARQNHTFRQSPPPTSSRNSLMEEPLPQDSPPRDSPPPELPRRQLPAPELPRRPLPRGDFANRPLARHPLPLIQHLFGLMPKVPGQHNAILYKNPRFILFEQKKNFVQSQVISWMPTSDVDKDFSIKNIALVWLDVGVIQRTEELGYIRAIGNGFRQRYPSLDDQHLSIHCKRFPFYCESAQKNHFFVFLQFEAPVKLCRPWLENILPPVHTSPVKAVASYVDLDLLDPDRPFPFGSDVSLMSIPAHSEEPVRMQRL